MRIFFAQPTSAEYPISIIRPTAIGAEIVISTIQIEADQFETTILGGPCMGANRMAADYIHAMKNHALFIDLMMRRN